MNHGAAEAVRIEEKQKESSMRAPEQMTLLFTWRRENKRAAKEMRPIQEGHGATNSSGFLPANRKVENVMTACRHMMETGVVDHS